jgi:Zn-dependent protease
MFHTYYFYIALLPSIILHEVSHGWVANFFGDPTAKNAKRLSLNPMRHIDPFGTILLPAIADRAALSAVRLRETSAGEHVAASQTATAVALRVARRAVRQHRAFRPSDSDPL